MVSYMEVGINLSEGLQQMYFGHSVKNTAMDGLPQAFRFILSEPSNPDPLQYLEFTGGK